MTHRGPIAAVGAAVSWTPGLATSEGDHSPAAWWDAEFPGTLEAGNRVSLWPDRSGNGWHLPQGTDSARPTWVDAVANGRPVIRFDGGDVLFLAQPDGPTWNLREISIFAVQRTTTFVNYAGYFVACPPTGADYNKTTGLVVSTGAALQSAGLTSAGIGLGSSVSDTSAWTLWRARIAGPSYAEIAHDGYVDATDASNSMSTGAQVGLLVGGRYNSVPLSVQRLNGDIAEILVYGAALSAADIAQVEAYLAAKWGVTVA